MAESQEKEPPGSSTEGVDLESLKNLDFGPSWADGSSPTKSPRPDRDRRPSSGAPRRGGREGGGGDRRPRSASGQGDRRPQRSQARGEGGERNHRRERGHHGFQPRGDVRQQEFKPTVQVDLYPQDEAFDALVSRLRTSARTYQLFEIAHLILEKPERFVAVVANFPRSGEAETRPLYFSVQGHLPFDSEEEALNHVIENHLDLFFESEEIEVEPPKGNFQMVSRCPVTGELLAPPNYHRYQEFLQRHYASRIHGMSFERFVSKVESVKEQESIDAWVEKMKKGFRYTLKDRAEGEPESFESMESVRHFLARHRKEQILGSGESVRFAGRDIDRLPQGDLRRSVEAHLERQRQFPLETANNLRGRLRRHKFTVYKKGSKGVSFVCAVKRKFRDRQTVFTDSIRNLIEFIEKNPMIPAARVSEDYLGLSAENRRPEKLKVTDAEIAAAKEARDSDSGAKTTEPEQREVVGEKESETAVQEVANQEEAPTPGPAAEADASSNEEAVALRQLMMDLRWLVTEGYVTEYGDGRLFAPPPVQEQKKVPVESAVSEGEQKVGGSTAESEAATPTGETSESVVPVAVVPERAVEETEASPVTEAEAVGEAGQDPADEAAGGEKAGDDSAAKT